MKGLFIMKKKPNFIIVIIAIIISITQPANIYASSVSDKNIFSNDKYSIFVPDTFSVDSETVANYTSLYKDNITIGISTHNNTDYEDAAKYTESQIADIANDTLDSLKAQSEAEIKITRHEIVSFSKNSENMCGIQYIVSVSKNIYPSVHIIYEGTMENGDPVYMEEYIVTTVNYKYTIVLYAGTAEDINNDDVTSVMDSFTVLDDLITHTEPADTGSVFTVVIISGIIVITLLIITLFIIIKYKKR